MLRAVGILFNLNAKMAHMNIDRVPAIKGFLCPHFPADLLAGHNAIRMRHQHRQNSVFMLRQMLWLAIRIDNPFLLIQMKVHVIGADTLSIAVKLGRGGSAILLPF